MKIAIVGSRNFKKMSLLYDYIINKIPNGSVIISGGANGIDKAAIRTAQNRYLLTEEYLPDWDTYGRSAGAIRNQQIVDNADTIVAFWDGKSKGTKITIDMAQRANKPCEVILDD